MTEDSNHLDYSKEMCKANIAHANKLIELAKKYNNPEEIGPIEKLRKQFEDILQEINEDLKPKMFNWNERFKIEKENSFISIITDKNNRQSWEIPNDFLEWFEEKVKNGK